MATINKITLLDGTTYDIETDWSNVTSKPTIPTKTSQLTNDSVFLTPSSSLNATKLVGGINSVGNTTAFVGVNPVFNSNAFAVEKGATVKFYLDDVEIVMTNNDYAKSLFDGTSACTYQPFALANQSTYIAYDSTKSYAKGNMCYYRPSGATKDMWYRCLVACKNVVPTNTSYWEDVSASGTYSGVSPKKFTSYTIEVRGLTSIAWENGVALYWRVAGQCPDYVSVTKLDTRGSEYDVNVVTNQTIAKVGPDVIYLGNNTNASTQTGLRFTFTGFTGNNYWNFALSQIATSGNGGSIEKAVMMRSGGVLIGNIYPLSNNTLSIGNSSNKFNTIYATTFNGKATSAGTADTANSVAWANVSGKPTIPSAVTESTVSGWGFTKNTGTYSKPSTGIPKTDLASDVQTSLGKADTALQSHQSLAGYATETWVTNKGYTTNTGTITGIKMNGASKGTSGVVDLGTVITSHQSLDAYTPTANLADVALNGEYGSLLNLPVVPTVVSELPNDAGYLDSTSFITTGGQTIVDSGALVSYSTSWNVQSVGGATNAYTFYLEVIETSVNTDAKTSAVTYKVYAKGNNNYSYNNFSAPTVTIKVDGTSLGAVNVTSISTTKSLVATKNNTVTHDADGTKTISVQVTYANAETSYLPKPHSSSAYSVALSTFTETEGVDIAGIRTPNGKVYNLADVYARDQIESISNVGYEMIKATNLVGRKWANGFLEYFIDKYVPAGSYTSWQSHYYRDYNVSITFPTAFTNALGAVAGYSNATCYSTQTRELNTTSAPLVRLMAFTNQSNLTGYVHIYLWGYWK